MNSVTEGGPRANRPDCDLKSIYYGTVTGVLVSSTLIAFAVWISLALRKGGNIRLLTVDGIGGKLTQTEAKALDFICGALFGPLLLAILNYFWFISAHVTAVNEKRSSDGVPLGALVEASGTTSGTYDLFKLHTLIRSRNPRFLLFGALVLLSAVAKTSFSNIVAYEAHDVDTAGASASLRLLNNNGLAITTSGPYKFTLQQHVDFIGQVLGMLTGLTYYNATDKLDQDAYIGVNSTAASMNALPPQTVALKDVPGYRLSIGCRLQPPDRLSVVQMGGYEVHIIAFFNDTMLQAAYPGQITMLQIADNGVYSFAGFQPITRDEVYLGYMTGLNLSGCSDPLPSIYGNVTYNAYDTTAFEFNGTKQIMSAWGLRCTVFRQEGLHNFTREPDQSWRRTSSTYSDTKQAIRLIADWQTRLNFHSPRSGGLLPGFGPAFDLSAQNLEIYGTSNMTECYIIPTDFRVLALNFLYAAGETERIAYEVINPNASGSAHEEFYQVQATTRQRFYRMTYVPLIFIVGLASIFAATLIAGGMVIYSWRTTSFKTWREVNALRLLIDGVGGLRDDPAVQAMRDANNGQLDQWAQSYKVRYSQVIDDAAVSIRLFARGVGG